MPQLSEQPIWLAVIAVLAMAGCSGGAQSDNSPVASAQTTPSNGTQSNSPVASPRITPSRSSVSPSPSIEARSDSEIEEAALRILAAPQRRPTRIDLFASKFEWGEQAAYPLDGSPMSPSTSLPYQPDEIRGELERFLESVCADAPAKRSALQLFDDGHVATLVPDTNLRAAIALIECTVAAPTLERFLGGRFGSVEYGVPVSPRALAQVTSRFTLGVGNRLVVTINERYRNEHFAYFTGLLAHEFLHDIQNNPNVEVINNAITSLVYMELLSAHPELADGPSEFARVMNTRALGLINSRPRGSPAIALLAKDGLGLFPEGRPVRDYFSWWMGNEALRVLEAPPELCTMLGELTEAPMAEACQFDVATMQTFGRISEAWLTATRRVRLSVLLELVSVEEIRLITGWSESEVVAHFSLEPTLELVDRRK